MIRKTLLLAALLGAGAAPAFAQSQPLSQSHPPSVRPPSEGNLCQGRVVVETVRPKGTIPGGFTYEVLLQNQNAQERVGYSVTVTFEGFPQLATATGTTIRIPSQTITMQVPAGFGGRSTETQFGTVSQNIQRIYYQAGVGARYDLGSVVNGGPAAVRLTNCVPRAM